MRPTILLLTIALGWIAALPGSLAAGEPAPMHGFDLRGGLIDPRDVYEGVPDRDSVHAIDDPRFLAGADRDGQLDPAARVLAVAYNGVAKAYPIEILDQHVIVNDHFDGRPVAVSFCPLCGTGMVFVAEARGQALEFGVSGLLYNSGVLLYDRATDSLWSQGMRTAVSGPMKGERLTLIPAQYTTWGGWLQQQPGSLLLSRDTGYPHDYDAQPYYDYRRLPVVAFPTVHHDLRITAKSWVVGVTLGEAALALPFEQLDRLEAPLRVPLGDVEVEVHWNREAQSARVFDGDGKELPATSGYWFAWVAFHPETALYLPGD
jgi:hypothetical protein